MDSETVRVLEIAGDSLAGRAVLLVGEGANAYREALDRRGARVASLGDAAVRYLKPGGPPLHRWLGPDASQPVEQTSAPDEDRFDVIIWVPEATGTIGIPEAAARLAGLTRDRLIVLADPDRAGPPRLPSGSGSTATRRAHADAATGRWLPAAFSGRWHGLLAARLRSASSEPEAWLGGSVRRFHQVQVKGRDRHDRLVIECRRPRIRDLVVVAGCNTSGKSTLCRALLANAHEQDIGVDLSDTLQVGSNPARKWPYERLVPQRVAPSVLVHHDLSSLVRQGLPDYDQDPAGELLRCAGTVHMILMVLPVEVLTEQMLASELAAAKPHPKPFHYLELRRFHEPGYLLGMYQDWIRFCLDAAPGRLRMYGYGLNGSSRQPRRLSAPREAYSLIREHYARVPTLPPDTERLAARRAYAGSPPRRSTTRRMLSKLRGLAGR